MPITSLGRFWSRAAEAKTKELVRQSSMRGIVPGCCKIVGLTLCLGMAHFLRNASILGFSGAEASSSCPSAFFKYLVKKETRYFRTRAWA